MPIRPRLSRARRAGVAVPGLAALALLVTAASPTGSAARWGEHGHRIAATAAVNALPAEMPAFFRAAGDELVWLDPDPDRWRDRAESAADPALNGANAPDHYLDLEWTTPGSLRAPNRYAFLDSLKAAGQTNLPGFLPFRIVELTQRIRLQFRQWRQMPDGPEKRYLERRIINDAGVLGHFVTDGANPHHTTIHHNGWVGDNPNAYPTDPRTHGRFESAFVGAQLQLGDIAPRVVSQAQAFPALRDAVLGYLQTTHTQLIPLYELDKAERFSETNRSARHKEFAAERLAAGATMLRDLWWTAWATSESAPAPSR